MIFHLGLFVCVCTGVYEFVYSVSSNVDRGRFSRSHMRLCLARLLAVGRPLVSVWILHSPCHWYVIRMPLVRLAFHLIFPYSSFIYFQGCVESSRVFRVEY